MIRDISRLLFGSLLLSTALWLFPGQLSAHCDTLAGPVVAAARAALEKGDVTPVLRWVKPEHEKEIRERFARALAVRKLSPEARELADTSFFENLVRIHRLGENAPYTGLQSDGKLDPVVAWTDRALDSGAANAVVELVTGQVSAGIRSRFTTVIEKKKRAEESIAAGREYVDSYVEYTHYVERLYNDALGAGGAAEEMTHANAH